MALGISASAGADGPVVALSGEALRHLLARAASVLTELARTEQDIADTFTSLARHDSSRARSVRERPPQRSPLRPATC